MSDTRAVLEGLLASFDAASEKVAGSDDDYRAGIAHGYAMAAAIVVRALLALDGSPDA